MRDDVRDRFNLQRFVDAQASGAYERALAEIRAGQKRSHWMWSRRRCEQSPGLSALAPSADRDLGRSPTAKYYGLSGEAEARAYLAHLLLGPRYRQAVAAVRAQLDAGKTLEAIFGALDAMKFRSSVEIFEA
jgi:uncharacterized protein (DUF1810 family)